MNNVAFAMIFAAASLCAAFVLAPLGAGLVDDASVVERSFDIATPAHALNLKALN